MTWSETVESYLRTLRISTARQYRVALDDFHRWYLGSYAEDPDPALLIDEEVREWRAHLSGVRKLAASTVNVRLSAVKSLVRHCGRTLETRGMRKVEQPLEPLTGRELGRLVAAIEGHQWGPEWMPARNLAMVALMTRFLRKGNDLATLRDILGHASITTTSRYLHADAARMQDMVEGL